MERETYGGFAPPTPGTPHPAPPERPAAPAPAPPGGPGPVRPRGSAARSATWSMVMGIAGLVVLPLVCSVVALLLGYGARRDIAAGAEGNAGHAQAGIVLGWVGLAGFVVLVALLVAGVEVPTPGNRD